MDEGPFDNELSRASIPTRIGAALVVVLAIAGAITSCASVANAQEENAVPESETPESRLEDEENFSWSLGMGFVSSPRPYRGTEPQIFVFPIAELRYKRFFVQGIRGGFDLVRRDNLIASVFAQASFQGLEPEESPFLEGMDTRDTSMDGGLEVFYRRQRLGFRLGLLSDVLGRNTGQEVSLLALADWPLGNLVLVFGAGPRWISGNRVDYFYGVREEEARLSRPAYVGKPTWNLDLNVTAVFTLGTRWSFLALVNRERLGSGITGSPIVARESAFTVLAALTRSF